MKAIGFIGEQQRSNKLPAFKTLLTDISHPKEIIDKVVSYLVSGVECLETFALEQDITENDLKIIGPSRFLTDGVWVWPSYYPYYLKKIPNLSIDESFLNYLHEKNFAKINPSEVNVEEAYHFLEKYLDIRTYKFHS